jgi:hypothetical protein
MKYKLQEVETSEFSFNPLHDYGLDKPWQSAGQVLMSDLGLEKFGNNVFIQKVLGVGLPIYVITYNSRYPRVGLTATRVKKLKFTWIGKSKRKGIHTYIKPMKLTPPLCLQSAMVTMTSGSLVVQRDIAGEYLRNPKVFGYTDYILDKKINQ